MELVQHMMEEHNCQGENCEEEYLETMEDWPETIEDTLIDMKVGSELTNCTWTKMSDPKWRESKRWIKQENCRVMEMPEVPWPAGLSWR